MVDWLMKQFIDWLAGLVVSTIGFVVDLLRNSVWVTPDVTALPQVRSIWSQNATIVNAAYVLGIIAAAALVMTHETVQVRYGLKELAPRVVFGAVAANLSLTWCSMIFETANSLTMAVTAQPVDGPGAMDAIRQLVVASIHNDAVPVLAVVAALIVVVLVVTLMFTWIARFALLLVLTVVAPFALAAYCVPQFDGVARLWWRSLFGALGTQLLQALTLYTGLKVFLDPTANIPALLGLGEGGVFNLFILIVLLWTTVKIPALMRRLVLSGGGSRNNVVGSVIRLVLVRRLFK